MALKYGLQFSLLSRVKWLPPTYGLNLSNLDYKKKSVFKFWPELLPLTSNRLFVIVITFECWYVVFTSHNYLSEIITTLQRERERERERAFGKAITQVEISNLES
jgi:hypothetical protein